MALSFIKKVFTFGKDKPAETSAVEAEFEQQSPDAVLPVADDPVLPEEMDMAGGPAADIGDGGVEAPSILEEAVPLPPADQMSDFGLVPLSLLEAEAEVEEVAGELPSGSSVDAIEDETPNAVEAVVEIIETLPEEILTPDVEDDISIPSTPPAVEMLDKAEDDILPAEPSEAAIEEPRPESPILPKGFATGRSVVEPEPVILQPKLSWFQRLRNGLARTSSQLTSQITALFTKRKLDDETLQDLEDLLIQADLGVETAMRVTDTLASERYGKDVTGEDVSRIMASEIAKVLKPVARPLQLDLSHKPHVILVVGVNGTGKTTTIGKLAAKLSGAGLKVMLAAGDTFRAAAIEQLKIWADRTKSEFIGTKLGADAAGLAYDAFEQAKAKKCDVLIVDTAGRLQNKAELMAELEKIVRVLGKLDPDAPHTVLQTLDATTGQNALNQVEIFRNVAGVNGLIMTKLDGTARGGILVAISAKHKLPVYFIGVGEGVEDLEPFEAEDFAHAIAGLGQ
ncbi:signal recognition particle-docking protein FtsY [Rhizobium ruizarguesonis]|jgi:fused signal recognition particle receptor|uniref:signal recognition particle-docking protein FtsY n=1 Tax=Rhizobium ruizarguesonis TaxID=2081791 RepID=UPI00102FF37F|nr:signal recognition particle-docking protein FtsY [Rhizobium ruizarguesonis]MBY5850008.1 signal recognition particle-docking protein FtsY [Rhizobium leguminosarum]MBY5885235.1 signal recognition particle-docking protein FtsY [Rhizobium leguminosarum]QSZ00738.1 signal recognition particle-docking protein FtsY [Rhizobium ruizarguesonis]TAZ85882.1 signal recognition particle-docking protein FtsY [Rhizobium ruizarguesonis]TBA18642.1 signal recognition particle-docking protein FtsY [Rhizobium rui